MWSILHWLFIQTIIVREQYYNYNTSIQLYNINCFYIGWRSWKNQIQIPLSCKQHSKLMTSVILGRILLFFKSKEWSSEQGCWTSQTVKGLNLAKSHWASNYKMFLCYFKTLQCYHHCRKPFHDRKKENNPTQDSHMKNKIGRFYNQF